MNYDPYEDLVWNAPAEPPTLEWDAFAPSAGSPVPDVSGTPGSSGTEKGPLTCGVPDVPDVPDISDMGRARPAPRNYRDGAAVLDDVEAYFSRFVIYPGEAERVAHVLWVAHAQAPLMALWESTPRLGFLSPEPGSGKSRALEVTEPLVPRPVHAVNATPAYLFRKVADPEGLPTILFDEIDTVFGPKAGDNEDVRGMLNAGHRKGAVAGRCVIRGKSVEVEELAAYCAVALAGLDDMPDTIMSRSVVVRMRRRAPGETVEPWRARINGPDADALGERLAAWAETVAPHLEWPQMPEGIEDRPADVWEPLLAVADLAGGAWPERARSAALALVRSAGTRDASIGVQLLRDLRVIFTAAGVDRLSTAEIVDALNDMPESPWPGFKPDGIAPRSLAKYLGKYEITSARWRSATGPSRGYTTSSLADAWTRYLPPLPSPVPDVPGGEGEGEGGVPARVAASPLIPENSGTSGTSGTPQVRGTRSVPGRGPRTGSSGTCAGCGAPMFDLGDGSTRHPTCGG